MASERDEGDGRADLLDRIAHGMRSPLGVLAHALQTMQAELGEQSESKRYAVLAGRAIRRLELMAERLSVAAATARGPLELYPQRLDLADLVRKQITDVTTIEGRREVVVDQDLETCDVRGDADRLQRAVAEILVNALQHSRRRVSVQLRCEAGRARLAIEDDGEGVPVPYRDAMFEKMPPSRSGLGLGLTSARSIVLAHEGTLTLEPSPQGARFVISLPLLERR